MSVKYPTPTINNDKKIKIDNHLKSKGMAFENALNISNQYYLSKGIANIHKKPTPINIVKVDYPKRSSSKIVEAYYQTPSTTDYNGIYRGKYIDYEAKETSSSSFSFTHIFKHQVDHLINIRKLGGIGFVIIYYKKYNEIYIFNIDIFEELYYKGEKKSINIDDANKYGIKVSQGYTPPVNYLKGVDELIDKNN